MLATANEWTIENWRVEPRWRPLRPLNEVEEPGLVEPVPPLLADLTAANVAAVLR